MKEELLSAIEIIKENTGLTQGEISERAGYKPNYLAEAISGGKISKKLLGNVKRTFYEYFNDVKFKSKPIKITRDLEELMGEREERLAANEANLRVLIVKVKELEATITKKSFSSVSLEFDRLAKGELMQILDELRSKQS